MRAVNNPPIVVGGLDNQMLAPGDTVTADVAEFFEDPEGDDLTFSASSSDTTVATASVEGSALTVAALANGSATVTITATDTADNSGGFEFTVTVEGPNQAPQPVGSIAPQALVAGDSVTVNVAAFFTDPDGDTLTYRATTSDAGVATASVSASIVTVAGVGAGTASVTVTASDPDGLTAAQEISVTVEGPNQAPRAVGTIDALTLLVGAEVTTDVASYFDDPDGDVLTFMAATSDDAVATASVSGSQVAVTGVAVGTANITITAHDPDGLSAMQTMGVTVSMNNPPTVIGGIDDQTLTVGDIFMAEVAELFEDPEGDDLTFSAASSDTAAATVSVEGSSLTVAAMAEGSTTVTVTATDTGDMSGAFDFSVTVEPPNQAPEITDTIPPQTLMVGGTVPLDASNYFSDPDGDELSYEAVSSNTDVVTALAMGTMIEIGAQSPGAVVVTVTASDPQGLTAAQQVMVTVEAPPPAVADTIPTHDMIVDSMVPLDVSPYFEGDGLTYTATTSDEMVAVASVDGSTVTTSGVGAVEDSVSVAILSVTATNAAGGSVTQDSIMVRVHQEAYDSLPGLSVNEEGELTANLGTTSLTLTFCLQLNNFPVGDLGAFTVFWSEWQRAVGSGWVTAQDNDKAHVVGRNPTNPAGSICPINIADEKFPPGIYRLVGHVQIGDESGFHKTPTFEKKQPES